MEEVKTTRQKTKNRLLGWLGLVIVGMLLAVGLRYAFVSRNDVHYHANFALYINGQRDEFKNFNYYEEVSACSASGSSDPQARAHMHDNVNHVVHVHDGGVTWGHFFANIGYTLGDKVLATRQAVYTNQADGGAQLRFILNGKPETIIANRVIKSEDRLLIDYSADSQSVLQQRFKTVETDAHHYNVTSDPSTCAGGGHEGAVERLKRTLGVGYN